MGNPLAIGALVAGAILAIFRWEIAISPNIAIRLDRWTGKVAVCTYVSSSTGLTCQ